MFISSITVFIHFSYVIVLVFKPADWDEDAPYEIVDEDAVKPEGWLDNEPLTIPDPGMQFPPKMVMFHG